MGRSRGKLVAALAALAALALVTPAAGTERQGIPGVPGIPHVSLPQPDAKAVFDVVVEGKASDINHSQLSGISSTCVVTEDGHVTEKDTYLRGKDVKIDFLRYGRTIVLKRDRGGQLGDTSLAVKVTIHRTASGGTSYVPSGKASCDTKPTDLSKNPDCGKNIPVSGDAMVLGWKEGRLSLDVSPNTQLRGFTSPDGCGEDSQTGITDALLWAWPKPVDLSTGSLPKSEIFGTAKTVTVLVHHSDIAPAHSKRDVTIGQLKGTISDTGSNQATVRLKRVG